MYTIYEQRIFKTLKRIPKCT